MLTRNEQNGLSGIPLLSYAPGLSRAFSAETTQHENSELLVVMTPHIVHGTERVSQQIVLPITAPR